jgi:hypothetical protein
VAAGALLVERAGPRVAPEVRDRFVEQTGGNPLALIELPSMLTPGQLAGDEPLPLPLTEGLERTFLERARRLPDDTQALLLVVAVGETGRLATVLAAAAAVGIGVPALDAAERAGLVRVQAGELDFRHPLVRSAVHQGATTAERQLAHRALALVLDGEADADRRAWHRAAGAVEPDEVVVRELEQAAGRSRARGGFGAACLALERAADPELRAGRLAAAADNAWLAGQRRRASGLLQLGRSHTSRPLLRADLDRLRGWIESGTGSTLAARKILLQAARDVAPVDAERALVMLVAAAESAWVDSDAAAGAGVGRLAAQLRLGGEPRTRFFAGLLSGFIHLFEDDLPTAFRFLRDAVALAEELDDAELLSHADHAALCAGDDAALYRLNAQVVARARAAGASATPSSRCSGWRSPRSSPDGGRPARPARPRRCAWPGRSASRSSRRFPWPGWRSWPPTGARRTSSGRWSLRRSGSPPPIRSAS